MPYIKNEDRDRLFNSIHGGMFPTMRNPGELNFMITCLAKVYMNAHGESYMTYNDIIGVLECVKQELYRRKIGPYEAIKCAENGDVY